MSDPSPLSLLVVCPHFPPENSIAALRIGSMTEHLLANGWDVAVLTRMSHPFPGFSVHDPVQVWRKRNDPGHGRFSTSVGRVASAISFRLSWPDEQFLWCRRAYRSIAASEVTYDVVVVSVPPFSGLGLGRRLARLKDAILVLDYRDLWTRSTYYGAGPVRRVMDRAAERRALAAAGGAVTVSAPLTKVLASQAPRGLAIETIMNGYEARDFPGTVEVRPPSDDPLRLVYLGELYPEKRDPTPLFQALAQDYELSRHVRVEFYGASVRHVLGEQVSRLGLTHCVSLSSRVEHAESLSLQFGADALLLLLWNDPREEGTVTGKLFEYLASRNRVLMLGYEQGVAADLVRSRSAGIVANSASDISSILWQWIEEKRTHGLRSNAPSVAAGLSRREQWEKFSVFLNQVARSHTDRDKTSQTKRS